jgi:hypothetical protein
MKRGLSGHSIHGTTGLSKPRSAKARVRRGKTSAEGFRLLPPLGFRRIGSCPIILMNSDSKTVRE